jgi:hypothetical protein
MPNRPARLYPAMRPEALARAARLPRWQYPAPQSLLQPLHRDLLAPVLAAAQPSPVTPRPRSPSPTTPPGRRAALARRFPEKHAPMRRVVSTWNKHLSGGRRLTQSSCAGLLDPFYVLWTRCLPGPRRHQPSKAREGNPTPGWASFFCQVELVTEVSPPRSEGPGHRL